MEWLSSRGSILCNFSESLVPSHILSNCSISGAFTCPDGFIPTKISTTGPHTTACQGLNLLQPFVRVSGNFHTESPRLRNIQLQLIIRQSGMPPGPSGAAATTNPPTSSWRRMTWGLVLSFLGNKLRNRTFFGKKVRRKRPRGKRSHWTRRTMLRGNKLELLGLTIAFVVLCLAIATLILQIAANKLARQGISSAQSGNEDTAKGSAIAENSYKLQAYGECQDRVVRTRFSTVLLLTESD